MVKRNSESVRNRSAMSWAESVQWSNTHKGKSGGSSRKDDGWCRETVDKNPVWGETTNTTKKILEALLNARLGSFIVYKNPVKKFFLGFVVYTTAELINCDLFTDLF